ncbi:MAG TPA: hypothetical protein DHV14_13565, partial [Micrococcales bacterium]|nr:hypothetical protein [Micrococcales bacterium]
GAPAGAPAVGSSGGARMRVLVIGGTGAFASRVTTACLASGDDVMVVSRGQRATPADQQAGQTSGHASAHRPGTLSWLQADRATLAAHQAEIEAFAPDAVVDAICFDAAGADLLARVSASARRVVLISTVDVYGEEVGAEPVTEEREPAPVTPYARGKLAAEHALLDAVGSRATIVRPSHMLGRGFRTAGLWGRTEHVVARLRAGRPVAVLDGGRGAITPVWAGDVAAWVQASLTAPRADGEVFNAVGGEITTMRHYLEAIAAHLGVTARLLPVPSTVVRDALGTAAQFAFHRPYSCAKAVRLLGHEPAGTLASMVAETVDAMPVRRLGVDTDLPPELLAADAAEDAIAEVVDRQARELAVVLAANDPR